MDSPPIGSRMRSLAVAFRTTLQSFAWANVLTALSVLGCDGSSGPDPDTRDEIVYHVWAGYGEADLHAVSADGARSRQLTDSPGEDRDPEVSPDGRRVAFTSDRDGNYEIYVVGGDGSDLVRVTNDPGVDTSPTWSPDGQRLAFVTDRNEGEWELYTVGANGTGLTRLTTNTLLDLSPHWSPDGSRIALSRNRPERPGEIDLFVVNSDGTNPIRLTDARSQESRPKWSPAGNRIAFISDTVINLVSGGLVLWAISIIDADGSHREQFTTFSSAAMQGFTWSPDGTRIVFDLQGELWAVAVNDKRITKLFESPTVAEAAPSWRRVP